MIGLNLSLQRILGDHDSSSASVVDFHRSTSRARETGVCPEFPIAGRDWSPRSFSLLASFAKDAFWTWQKLGKALVNVAKLLEIYQAIACLWQFIAISRFILWTWHWSYPWSHLGVHCNPQQLKQIIGRGRDGLGKSENRRSWSPKARRVRVGTQVLRGTLCFFGLQTVQPFVHSLCGNAIVRSILMCYHPLPFSSLSLPLSSGTFALVWQCGRWSISSWEALPSAS